MCDKNIITSNGKRLFLASFEFISGEYEQSFHRFLYARDEQDLDWQIRGCLSSYYGVGNTCQVEGDVYFYFDEEIAVKATGWLEVKDFKDVVDRMLW